MGYIEGIDVSDHNGVIDWTRVARAGIAFAFCKAAQGTGFVADSYRRNVQGAMQNGILVSPYHFYEWAADPDRQARHFADVTGRIPNGMLQPACDLEMPGDGAGNNPFNLTETKRRVHVYLQGVKAYTGADPIIYSYPYAWQTMTGGMTDFAGVYPFWPASYRVTPALFGGAPAWTFWQYTATGWLQGVGAVDRDRFFGTLAQLRRYAQR